MDCLLPMGQSTGLIDDILGAEEVVENLVREAEEVVRNLTTIVGSQERGGPLSAASQTCIVGAALTEFSRDSGRTVERAGTQHRHRVQRAPGEGARPALSRGSTPTAPSWSGTTPTVLPQLPEFGRPDYFAADPHAMCKWAGLRFPLS
ncbi:MAG TPA: hypothetical protein VL595_11210 [Pseudonocardia sp.]|nr:hypothetical protein [Pseudonocardia sp.]